MRILTPAMIIATLVGCGMFFVDDVGSHVAAREPNAVGDGRIDPRASEVLARYINAIGGQAAWEKYNSSMQRGEIDINEGGMTGQIVIWQKPGKFLVDLSLEDFGTIRRGWDGDVTWSIHPNDGAEILSGIRQQDLLASYARVHPAMGWNRVDFDGQITSAGIVELDGNRADKIVFQPREGSAAIRYFDSQSGRLLKVSTRSQTANGPVELEVRYSNYQTVQDITLSLTQDFAIRDGHSYQIRFTEVLLNPQIPDSRFELPGEIRDLANRSRRDPSGG